EARMQPLRDAIALEEKPLRAAVVAANHTVRLPDDVCPAALRGPALHHDCEGKLRLLHSPALYLVCYDFPQRNSTMKKVIPLVSARSTAAHFGGGPLADTRGRAMHDLRISVTDRCNFRCVYCMPREMFGADHPFLPYSAILSFEEITRLARIFVGLGVQKIRLTGGEPLVRRELHRLVAMLAALGVEITLTTNGSLLAKNARALKAAGLHRVTVSLDSLDDATFRAMNDADFPVAKVIESIEAAAAEGLAPIKINTVVKRGVNDQDIVRMAERWRGTGHIVRFIEYMDVGSTNGW